MEVQIEVDESKLRGCRAERGLSFANAKLDRSRSIPTLSRAARDNGLLSVRSVIASPPIFPLLIVLFCFSAAAQKQPGGSPPPLPATSYKLIGVKVTGSKRFTQQEVAAASGLPVGTVAHEEDFKKAARQLGETGAFGDITYSYSYSSAGTRLALQVVDADKFIPVRFTDFVWFTDADLLEKVHERVPLFNGELPTSGRLPDQVSDVIQAILVENHIPGHVEYLRTNNKTDQLDFFDYSVAGVSIRIHNFDFPGAGTPELSMLQAASEKLSDREYAHALLSNFVEHALLPIYHEHGYLKASSAPAKLTVVKPAAADASDHSLPPTLIDVTFAVTPGLQYKLTQWDWSGNNVISTETLQPLLHAEVGQIANTVKLEADLRAVQTLYRSRGYILAGAKVNAEFDDVTGGVIFHLVVHEDALYHMGELQFRGLDNNLTARLRAAWKLHPGDIYDGTYLSQFLPQARKLLPPSLDWEVDPHETAIVRDKAVDVDLQYTVKAAQ
jgi:outer membrane protein assembly factor BamA